jgi:hypothetical protein
LTVGICCLFNRVVALGEGNVHDDSTKNVSSGLELRHDTADTGDKDSEAEPHKSTNITLTPYQDSPGKIFVSKRQELPRICDVLITLHDMTSALGQSSG